jgi:hypothetical protein
MTGTGVIGAAVEDPDATSWFGVAVVDGGTAAATEAEPDTGGGIAAPTATGAPHLLQNFPPAASCIPHFVQKRSAGLLAIALSLRAPHFVQNASDSVSAAPHCVQTSAIDSSKPPSQTRLVRVFRTFE